VASQEDLKSLEHVAQMVAALIGELADDFKATFGGPKVLFALTMFTEGKDGWATYCSNAEREDMIDALEEMVEKLKKGQDKH
jgi:hypothetical protein